MLGAYGWVERLSASGREQRFVALETGFLADVMALTVS
jgi:hypothetical protein